MVTRCLALLALAGPAASAGLAQAEDALRPGDEAEVVRRVLAGGTVRLGQGIFLFDTGWHLSNDVEIVGDGREATVLRFNGAATVGGGAIEWHGQSGFRLAHLALDYQTAGGGDLIRVEAGTAELADVIVRGNYNVSGSDGGAVAGEQAPGSGVVLGGNAQGYVFDSTLQYHGGAGLHLTGSARGVVERSMILDNGRAGVETWDHSAVLVETSTIAGNPIGVSAGGNAWFTLVDTTLHSNAAAGVESVGLGGGLLLDSWVHEHDRIGIVGNDQSWTTVLNTTVSLNQTGLGSYGATGFARFTVVDSEFADNGFQGMSTGVSTSLVVIDSVVRNSAASGIALGSSAMGAIVGTALTGNGDSGIECWYSHGALLENTMYGNAGYGFERIDESRCRDSGSEFELNGLGATKVWESE